MKIQFVMSERSGSHYHRLLNPMQYMQWSSGDSCEMIWIGEDERRIDCDILYYNKYIATPPDVIRKWQDQGMKVIVDVDDLWILPPGHINYKAWQDADHSKLIEQHIELADLVICTSVTLQNRIRMHNKNTVVIPNAFPYGRDNYVPRPIAHQKTTFMYMGGSTHLPDVELMRLKFKRISSIPYIKDNIEVVLAGYEKSRQKKFFTPDDLTADNQNFIIEDCRGDYDKMASVFSMTGGDYRILPSTNLDEYINYYDQADVALCPLVESEWNGYKSSLKIAEAGCKGIPVICSKVSPYWNQLPNYSGVYWITKDWGWPEAFVFFLKNPDISREMGNKLMEQCKKDFNLFLWNELRMDLFKKLVA